MNIDLDFDEDLTKDAQGFGIGSEIVLEPVELLSEVSNTKVSDLTDLEAAIMLAMEVCQWEHNFYTWCDMYLYGKRQEALRDISFVRAVLKQARSHWGPRFFTTHEERQRKKYYAVMAAQAALSAVERSNKIPLIQKIVYYASVAKENCEGDI